MLIEQTCFQWAVSGWVGVRVAESMEEISLPVCYSSLLVLRQCCYVWVIEGWTTNEGRNRHQCLTSVGDSSPMRENEHCISKTSVALWPLPMLLCFEGSPFPGLLCGFLNRVVNWTLNHLQHSARGRCRETRQNSTAGSTVVSGIIPFELSCFSGKWPIAELVCRSGK